MQFNYTNTLKNTSVYTNLFVVSAPQFDNYIFMGNVLKLIYCSIIWLQHIEAIEAPLDMQHR